MPVLLLIRHALTELTGKKMIGWTPGVHLSEKGRAQAEQLAQRLSAVPVTSIYSSPLERCRETAEPLAAFKGLDIHVAPDIGEIRVGEWTGRPLAQLARTKLWRSIQQSPSTARFPGGETLLEVQERAVGEVTRLMQEHPRGVVALVSHGDPIRLLLAHFAGVHVDLFQRIVVDPASVSVVAAGDGMPRIVKVNDTGGLDGLARRRPRRRAKVRG